MNQMRQPIWLKSNKAEESTEGDFLQKGFGCAQQCRPADRRASTAGRAEKAWSNLLTLLRKCVLDWRKRCRGKIWVPKAHESRVWQNLLLAVPSVEQT